MAVDIPRESEDTGSVPTATEGITVRRMQSGRIAITVGRVEYIGHRRHVEENIRAILRHENRSDRADAILDRVRGDGHAEARTEER